MSRCAGGYCEAQAFPMRRLPWASPRAPAQEVTICDKDIPDNCSIRSCEVPAV